MEIRNQYSTDIFDNNQSTIIQHDVSAVSVVSHPSSSHCSLNIEDDELCTIQPTNDEEVCKEFLRCTCGCKKAAGSPCSSLFPLQHYVTFHSQSVLLTQNELDMVLLGSIMSTALDDSHSVKDG